MRAGSGAVAAPLARHAAARHAGRVAALQHQLAAASRRARQPARARASSAARRSARAGNRARSARCCASAAPPARRQTRRAPCGQLRFRCAARASASEMRRSRPSAPQRARHRSQHCVAAAAKPKRCRCSAENAASTSSYDEAGTDRLVSLSPARSSSQCSTRCQWLPASSRKRSQLLARLLSPARELVARAAPSAVAVKRQPQAGARAPPGDRRLRCRTPTARWRADERELCACLRLAPRGRRVDPLRRRNKTA